MIHGVFKSSNFHFQRAACVNAADGFTSFELKVAECDFQRDKAMRIKKTVMKTDVVPTERIRQAILMVRGLKFILDRDLAMLYGVETRALNQAVKRNWERFPGDFMFELTREEIMRISQFVICLRAMRVGSRFGSRGALFAPRRDLQAG